ncbi:MAG: hypothetical protein FJY77_05895 [Candidatus Altiarchaeales archaeon]|nr:hypothetical protein [Candidatus Altiarchaeales archaeon]
MTHSGKPTVRTVEKSVESQREAEVRRVSEKIEVFERNCDREGFDSEVVEDIGGILTCGVCLRSGVNLDVDRLGVSLLDEDRAHVELDMANRLRSKSGYLSRAAEEVLGPLLDDSGRGRALAYWTTVNKRLFSKRVSDVERSWLGDEDSKQDSILMRNAGGAFKAALSRDVRRDALSVFYKIRRAGNKVPVLGRLFKFG